MKIYIILLQLSCIFLISTLNAEQTNSTINEVDKSHNNINTLADVIKITYEYTGFEEIKSISEEKASSIVQMVTFNDTTLPFIRNKNVSKRVWKITLNNIYLDLPDWDDKLIETYNPKDFIVIIDSTTGNLLKIYSKSESNDPDLAPEPPAELSERQFSESQEIFHGFNNIPPNINFIDALNSAAGSNPLKAKEIVAYLFMYSKSDSNPKPAWHIIGRGIPPVEFHPQEHLPMYMRNRMRSVIDAETGKLLLVSSSPHVLRREEDK